MNRATTTIIIVVLLVLVIGFIAFTPAEEDDRPPTFGSEVDYQITGIDAGAGIMQNTEQAMEVYELENWDLVASSDQAMTAEVQAALEDERPIVATAWTPHAVFALGELRKLDDPEMIYNDPDETRVFLEEHAPDFADLEVQSDVIASVVHPELSDNAPLAYELLREFRVDTDDESEWIYEVTIDQRSAEEVAAEWFEANRDQFEIPEDVELGQEEVVIGIPPWTGEIVRSQILAGLLEDAGYEVQIEEFDIGLVYTALAEQDIDITVGGWLPTTHQSYWEEEGDRLEIAGINVSDTWLGLVVPEFVDQDIQSIADLKD